MRVLIIGKLGEIGPKLKGAFWHEDVIVETMCSGFPEGIEYLKRREPYDLVLGLENLSPAEQTAFRGLLKINSKYLEGLTAIADKSLD